MSPLIRLLSVLLLALAGSSSAQQSGTQGPIPVGINLRPVSPYDRSWVFADAMKMASEWEYTSTGPKPPMHAKERGTVLPRTDEVPLDAQGWPQPRNNRPVSCRFFVGMRGYFPVGEYVCTWKGKGKLTFLGAVGIVSEEPNRLVVRVDGVSGGQPGIMLSDVDLSDPIRDIHVWLPGLEDSCHYFHPSFLEKLRPFSVLRFYPWMRIYASSGRWAKRGTLTSARQATGEGVAVEYMVELCNELHCDPWFCIPHTADAEYVRKFATLVRDSLHHKAKIYVEFSNEVWNTDYAAGQWAREQARARGVQATQVTAEAAIPVFDIWHEVFGRQKDRIVRVAGAQLHNPGIANNLCRALNGKFDAIAIGAYFGARPDADPVDDNSSADQLMAAARSNLDNIVLARISDHKALADTFAAQLGRPIALITYEGGQSITARAPGGGLDLAATLACQRSPAMFDAYRALIEGAAARGVELFVGYDFVGARSAADTFSVLEYLDEPMETAVKYRALIQGWETHGQ